jgi:HsdM N-terminal domain
LGDAVDRKDLAEIRRTLWAAADQLRANSTLAPSEYRGPVLGLIFIAYAEHRHRSRFKPCMSATECPDEYRKPGSANPVPYTWR